MNNGKVCKMQYVVYDLSEPIYDLQKPGPFLRFPYSRKYGKNVRVMFPTRRSHEFKGVAGPIELIHLNGTVEALDQENPKICVPDAERCNDRDWRGWKKFEQPLEAFYRIENGADIGIVTIFYTWMDCDSYTMDAYKNGQQFASLEGTLNFDQGEEFWREMLKSDDPAPFIKQLVDYHDMKCLPTRKIGA